MPVTVRIPAALRSFTGGRDRVQLHGAPATVGEALQEVGRLYPGVRDRVLLEEGTVRPHVNVFVGTENIRDTGGLATPLRDGSEITILPAVSGGAPHCGMRLPAGSMAGNADCGMKDVEGRRRDNGGRVS